MVPIVFNLFIEAIQIEEKKEFAQGAIAELEEKIKEVEELVAIRIQEKKGMKKRIRKENREKSSQSERKKSRSDIPTSIPL